MDISIGTFVFVDCETTGLPYQEYNRTRITELSMAAVESAHLTLGCFPRVLNKLSFCFNPCKVISPTASKLTGLSNDLLEYQPAFSANTANLIRGFLELHKKPICLVAHNGFGFDYPIIKAELERVGSSLDEELLCCDTLQMFRTMHEREMQRQATEVPPEFQDDFDELLVSAFEEVERVEKVGAAQGRNECTPKKLIAKAGAGDAASLDSLYYNPASQVSGQDQTDVCTTKAKKQLKFGRTSFKLGDVYMRLTKKAPVDAHQAEVDINMLVECAAVLGVGFVRSAAENCKKLSEVPVMRPGKKLGM